MPFDTKKAGYLTALSYRDVINETFGVHSSLTTGIPDARFVYLNTEAANTNGETITDNVTVGFATTAGSVATALAGVVKVGTQNYSDLILLPGTNRDINVTVTTLGLQFVEVAPGTAITVGQALQSNTVGQAVVTGGTATGLVARSAASGAGTASNPEYVLTFVK